MTRRVLNLDWSATPLGPIARWPDALIIVTNAILDQQHPMILFWGEDLVQLYNDAAIPVVGPEKHPGALGQPARECWAEAWSITGPQIMAAFEGQSCWNENQHVPIYRNGKLDDAWFTYSYSPVREAGGRICGVLVNVLETTKQVLSERAVQDAQWRLLALFEQAPVFFAVLKGAEHIYEMVNPLYLRLIGGRDVLGKSVREAIPEAAEQGYVAILDEVFRTGKPFVGLNQRFVIDLGPGREAEELILDFTFQPLRDIQGLIEGIIVVGVNMTERKVSDVLLQEQRERFDFATDVAQIGYWFCDLPFDKLMWDARVKEHFWLSPDTDVDIELFYERLHPEDRESTRQALEYSIANRTRYDIEYRTLSPQGEQKWIRAIGRTAYDADGKPLRFDGVTLDVTALKEVHDARNRAEEALIRSEKLALVGRLAATISHEINNPLEAVTNLLYLIAGGAADETSKRYAAAAQAELARVSHIVTHTLRFNRQGNTASREKISDILESAISIYGPRLKHSGIYLRREYDDSALELSFASELRQVFANLIANSFDATRQGDTLLLRVRKQTNWRTGEPGLRVSVADSGHGMDLATERHIFEAFFTTKGHSGTGLGLWVSREILNKHHALIRMKSRQSPDPSGTVFSVWIPLDGR